ncbi:MAG: PP2C family serine/threonine-protein phosphatase [Planctomycetota bacterium]|jgi:hypothetical protein
MRTVLDIRWAPKHGNSADEYEDAFAPYESGVHEGARLRFAVADGATEAAFSKLWARLLVAGYRKGWVGEREGDGGLGLERLARIWRRRTGRKALPWYGEEKRRLGSFAALVGLELSGPRSSEPLRSLGARDSKTLRSPPAPPVVHRPPVRERSDIERRARTGGGPSSDAVTSGTWRAYSVGDCCLFHLRGDRLLGSFPIEDPDEFGSRPVLLSSNAARNSEALASAATARGEWAAGDEFCLMSDALACWFLTEHRQGEAPWDLAREDEADFPDLISHLRAQCGLHNDDVTLLRITPGPGEGSVTDADG